MDKFEYKVRADEIKSLIAEGEYVQAAEIADTIDWRRVKSVMMLCMVSDLYKVNRRYEDAKNMLLLAYERKPGGRTICYSLCELCIKTEEFVQAVNYYNEFVKVAPKDSGRYILQYKLYEAQNVNLEERIGVLEELKKRDYREKWAYELAYLYHRVGLGTRCVEECDELILWFGDGKYVVKAMELKMLHQPLTPSQQDVYDHRFDEYVQAEEPYPEDGEAQNYEQQDVYPDPGEEQPPYEGYERYEQEYTVEQEEAPRNPEELDIQVKTMDVGKYNTINLQKELAAGLQEVLGTNDAYGSPEEEPSGYGGGGDGDREPEEMIPGEAQTEVFFGETGEIEEAALEAAAVQTGNREAKEAEEPVSPEPEDSTSGLVMKQMKEETKEAEEQASPKNLEEVLSQETDGQIRMVLPERTAVERQITGQMKIDDILAEWERTKKENEEKCREEVRQHVLRQTGPMFTEFEAAVRDGLLEQLEGDQTEKTVGRAHAAALAGTIQEPAESRKIPEAREEAGCAGSAETADWQEGQTIPDYIEEPGYGQWTEPEEQENSNYGEPPVYVEDAEALPSPEPWEGEEDMSSLEPWEGGEETSSPESWEGEEDLSYTGEAEIPEELDFIEEAEYGEWAENLDDSDYMEFSEFPGSGDETEIPDEIEEADRTGAFDETEEAYEAEPLDEIEEAYEEEPLDEIGETYEEEILDEIEEAYEEESLDEIEEAYEEETPDEIEEAEGAEKEEEEVLRTEASDFLEALEQMEEIQEQEEAVGEETAQRQKRVLKSADDSGKHTLEQEKAKVRGLTREEKELFAPFIQNRQSREQLVKALDGISMAAYTGNVVITGEEGMDTMTLAKNMIREVRMTDSNFSGKVARITGQGLNRKNVRETLEGLNNGALIIQKASGMDHKTAAMLHTALQQEKFGIIVIMEDTKKAIQKLFLGVPQLFGDFTARMDLEALSNDTLVTFGKRYAREKEYSIDDLGMLALHTRIEECQTIDHAVTVIEVKQIIDEAIRHANRKTLGHFFDILLARRYDDEDMIILTEKDFVA